MGELAVAITVNLMLGVILLALLRRRRDAGLRLRDAEEARVQFRVHFPEADGAVTVGSDGQGALFDLGGTVGLLERRGGRWNARLLAPGDVAAVQVDGERVALRISDFAWPRARLRIADATVRSAWVGRLGGLRRAGAGWTAAGAGHA
jgi:hypothetical protein